MSRISEERKDLYKHRDSTMTSSSTIRNIHSTNMDKDKLETAPFIQHKFSADASFRTHELLKPLPKNQQGRNIVSSTMGPNQLHSMPPLLPNYIPGGGHLVNPVPLNNTPMIRSSIRTGQHAFQTHIPVGIGAGPVVVPKGINQQQRSSLPTLKPTNLQNQIQLPLNQIGLPSVLPPAVPNMAGSPRVSSHVLLTENCIDNRGITLSSDQHLRGNVQATQCAQATIQVIAPGTNPANHAHLPSTFLNKNLNLNSNSNMLKISVSSHSSNNPPTGMSISTFKLGLGKSYPVSSNTLIPSSTTSVTRSDIQELRPVVGSSPYNRFPVNHSISLSSHHISSQFQVSSLQRTQSSITISNIDSRPHAVGVPYHPISGAAAYVFHDMGIHGFSHQLLRPATTSINTVPTFMPIVSVAVSNKEASHKVNNSHNTIRPEGLTIQGSTPFNIHNLYPNLQASNVPVVAPASSTSTNQPFESTIRPSILQRKRPTDAFNTLFPIQPTDKENVSSPYKLENGVVPTKLLVSSNMSEIDRIKNINHSILNLTSDVKTTAVASSVPLFSAAPTDQSRILVGKKLLASSTHQTAQSLASLSNINTTEASPKKKPRKQSIITTEDKYGPAVLNNLFNVSSADADEEFLKSNETMKDITPPKSTVATNNTSTTLLQSTSTNMLHSSFQKQLFPTVPSGLPFAKAKQENKEIHLNGMLAPLTTSTASNESESAKYYIVRRRPQVGITHGHKINTKAAHSHFYRHSDVRVKDDKKTSTTGIADNLLTKASLEAASGWKLYHLSDQLHDMMDFEKEICDEILDIKEELPLPKASSPLSYHNNVKLSSEDVQLRLIHELLQGNIQRCSYSVQHLNEAKETMFQVLEHKTKALELFKSHKFKPRIKKKHST